MRVPREQFRSLSLEVHGILSDVPLHDVTAVDLPGGGAGRTISDVRVLLARENVRAANPIVRGLFALRALLGRVFGWDSARHMHPETSSIHRLSSDIKRRSALPPGALDGLFRVLYVLERVAGRGSERDGACLPSVRAYRGSLWISSVLGGLCATRVPTYPALHGAYRAVPPVHRLSGDLSQDPESLGGALHTPSRSTCIGYRLTSYWS